MNANRMFLMLISALGLFLIAITLGNGFDHHQSTNLETFPLPLLVGSGALLIALAFFESLRMLNKKSWKAWF